MGNHSLIINLEFLETWSDSFFEFQKLPLEYIENIFKRLQWEYQHQGDKLFVVNAYVITLLLELNELYNEAVHSNKASIDISRKFKNEVYKNLQLHLPVSEYANRLSITPNHLNKSIKSNTGLTASELINRIKITEAKYLLMRADLNVSAVAEQLGFSDSSYFSRFFKKHESVSPIEFQRMIDLS
jgi:AraC-like DNA-binding protein